MMQPEILPPVNGLNDLLDDLGTAALCLPWAIIFRSFSSFSQRVSAFISGSVAPNRQTIFCSSRCASSLMSLVSRYLAL